MFVVRRVEFPAVGNVARPELKIEIRRASTIVLQRVVIRIRLVVPRKDEELRRRSCGNVRRKGQRASVGNRAFVKRLPRRVPDVEEKLGALGVANMWIAVFGDVGVTLLCVINAMRALKA